MKQLRAGDTVRMSTELHGVTVRERDLRELAPNWHSLSRLRRLRVAQRALDDGIIQPTGEAFGWNKVLNAGFDKLLKALKGDATYTLTHLDIGTSSQAPAETDTGTVTHVDAAVGKARVGITTRTVSSKTLLTSTFILASEYNGSTLREVCMFDAATGGTAYNRALFTAALAKVSTDSAIVNLDHTLSNT